MTVTVFGKPNCPQCERAKMALAMRGIKYVYKALGKDYSREDLLRMAPDARTFPVIQLDDHIGTLEDALA